MKGWIFLLLCSTAAYAQEQAPLSERLMPHAGFMYEFITLTETPPTGWQSNFQFYNISLGAYVELAQTRDVASIGLDVGGQAGLRWLINQISWMGQAPVYAMGRIGARATRYNTQKIGFAAGIGGVVSYLSVNQGAVRFRQLFANPAVVLEGTLNTGGNPLTARLHVALSRPVHNAAVFAPGGGFFAIRPSLYNNIGIGLLYAL